MARNHPKQPTGKEGKTIYDMTAPLSWSLVWHGAARVKRYMVLGTRENSYSLEAEFQVLLENSLWYAETKLFLSYYKCLYNINILVTSSDKILYIKKKKAIGKCFTALRMSLWETLADKI